MIAQLDADYLEASPWKGVTRVLSWLAFEGRPVTTRGRWINPLVFRFLDLARRLPAGRDLEPPILIVGTGRSGTTILGKVLSLHPEVGFLNEPKALWHAAYPAEDVIGNYTRGAARYRLEAEDAGEETADAVRRMYGTYLSLVRASRVLDKFPEMIFRVPFVRRIFPGATFLFLVRDGWDTVRSIDRWSDRLGDETGEHTHDWWGVDDRKWRLLVRDVVAEDPSLREDIEVIEGLDDHRDRAAVEWIVTMREGMKWLRRLPGAFHLLRYEDLVREPRDALSDLLAACGLSQSETVLRYAEGRLRSRPHKPPCDLHPAVAGAFRETMHEMGYRR